MDECDFGKYLARSQMMRFSEGKKASEREREREREKETEEGHAGALCLEDGAGPVDGRGVVSQKKDDIT